jgi:hypothetical protein
MSNYGYTGKFLSKIRNLILIGIIGNNFKKKTNTLFKITVLAIIMFI